MPLQESTLDVLILGAPNEIVHHHVHVGDELGVWPQLILLPDAVGDVSEFLELRLVSIQGRADCLDERSNDL